MKTQYDIKDIVWIHLGERKLTKGRIVEIIDLEHLDEGHDPDDELYVIEVQTGIDPVYEVRNFKQISPDAQGPIALFRREGLEGANRFLKKVGLPIPKFDEWAEGKQQPTKPENIVTTGVKKPKKFYYKKRPKKTSHSTMISDVIPLPDNIQHHFFKIVDDRPVEYRLIKVHEFGINDSVHHKFQKNFHSEVANKINNWINTDAGQWVKDNIDETLYYCLVNSPAEFVTRCKIFGIFETKKITEYYLKFK